MWIKSSQCDTSACVEVKFVKSSQCGASTDCVEVAIPEGQDDVIIRNSQDENTTVTFDKSQWNALLAKIRAGEMDV